MPRVEVNLPIEFRRVRAERHETLPSTNDEAFRRAGEGAPDGLVVWTQHQTAGRGRQGRDWWDRPGDSVLASILLRPELALDRYPQLGMAMAVSVAEAAERLVPARTFQVKWPNDVLTDDRKVAGILAETRASGGSTGGRGGPTGGPTGGAAGPLVVGFGVNVNQIEEAFPATFRDTATSLRIAADGRALDPRAVLREILARFDGHYARASADPAAFWSAVRTRLPKPGATITVTSGAHKVTGTVEGYTDRGAIIVRDAEGVVLTLVAGEITG